MTSNSLRIEWRACTDRGSVREVNEDSFAAMPESGIWVVADGMGGHERGDWASACVVEEIEAVAPDDQFNILLQNTSDAVHRANAAIYAESQTQGAHIGSTVVSLVISRRRFGIIWAGDSRAYLLRDHVLHQLTRDHTQVQALVDRGILAPEDASTHPMSHVLSKAVGVEEALELEGFADDMRSGDVFLLCSDGLYGTLAHAELQSIIEHYPPDECSQRLISRCLEIGAKDNVTAIVIHAQEPTQLVFASATGQPDEV